MPKHPRIVFGVIPVLVDDEGGWTPAAKSTVMSWICRKLARDVAGVNALIERCSKGRIQIPVRYTLPEQSALGWVFFRQ